MGALEKKREMKGKLTEINSKLEEIDAKARDITNNSNESENVETFLADYRQKIDQLELLISNLTVTEPPKSTSDNQSASNKINGSESTWRSLMNSKLKRAKYIISKINSFRSIASPAVTTVTKYLPTGTSIKRQ